MDHQAEERLAGKDDKVRRPFAHSLSPLLWLDGAYGEQGGRMNVADAVVERMMTAHATSVGPQTKKRKKGVEATQEPAMEASKEVEEKVRRVESDGRAEGSGHIRSP